MIIRKEKPVDQAVLSCDILGLLQMNIDFTSNPVVYELSRETLVKIIKNTKSSKLASSCIQALTLMNYICDGLDEDTEEILMLFRDIIIKHKDPENTIKAIVGWCLISSLLPIRQFNVEGYFLSVCDYSVE